MNSDVQALVHLCLEHACGETEHCHIVQRCRMQDVVRDADILFIRVHNMIHQPPASTILLVAGISMQHIVHVCFEHLRFDAICCSFC